LEVRPHPTILFLLALGTSLTPPSGANALRRHVYSDLRPYLCLHKDCRSAEREFTRRHEWTEHELKNHWKVYQCPSGCDLRLSTATECRDHIQSAHFSAIPDSQLDAIVDLSTKPLQVEDGILCPLCNQQLSSFRQYQSHVGRHQEQLALFALPSVSEADAAEDLESNDDSRDGEDESIGNNESNKGDGGTSHHPKSADSAMRVSSSDGSPASSLLGPGIPSAPALDSKEELHSSVCQANGTFPASRTRWLNCGANIIQIDFNTFFSVFDSTHPPSRSISGRQTRQHDDDTVLADTENSKKDTWPYSDISSWVKDHSDLPPQTGDAERRVDPPSEMDSDESREARRAARRVKREAEMRQVEGHKPSSQKDRSNDEQRSADERWAREEARRERRRLQEEEEEARRQEEKEQRRAERRKQRALEEGGIRGEAEEQEARREERRAARVQREADERAARRAERRAARMQQEAAEAQAPVNNIVRPEQGLDRESDDSDSKREAAERRRERRRLQEEEEEARRQEEKEKRRVERRIQRALEEQERREADEREARRAERRAARAQRQAAEAQAPVNDVVRPEQGLDSDADDSGLEREAERRKRREARRAAREAESRARDPTDIIGQPGTQPQVRNAEEEDEERRRRRRREARESERDRSRLDYDKKEGSDESERKPQEYSDTVPRSSWWKKLSTSR